MSAETFGIGDVIGLYEATAGGRAADAIPWGIGPVTEDDVHHAVTNALIAGDLDAPDEPWSASQADIIRDHLVGIARSRIPQYRVAVVIELTEDGTPRYDTPQLAVIHDDAGVADNWQAAAEKFRAMTGGTGPFVPQVAGLGPTTVSRSAARIGVSKRTLQRRRAAIRKAGVDPDIG